MGAESRMALWQEQEGLLPTQDGKRSPSPYSSAQAGRGPALRAASIDFDAPADNDWLAVNQLTVCEGQQALRPDLVLYVNGLPLAVIELENAADEDATVWTAFQQLQTYQALIPSLFATNAALVASDGVQARIGALGAGRKWLEPWRAIGGEADAPATLSELQVVLEGVFEHRRFLDLVRYFIVFEEAAGTGGGLVKKMAGYHKFHAVNAALPPPDAAVAAAHLRESPRHGEWADIPVGEIDSVRAWVVYRELSDAAVREVRALDADEVHRRLAAVAAWGIARPAATERFGIMGFCWGGAVAFAHATREPDLGASVVYYGSSPEAEALAGVQAPILGLYGGYDARVNVTILPAESALRALGRTYEVRIYDGAGHGFLRQQEGRDGANRRASEQTWLETVAWLGRHLEGRGES